MYFIYFSTPFHKTKDREVEVESCRSCLIIIQTSFVFIWWKWLIDIGCAKFDKLNIVSKQGEADCVVAES